jgi:hypothetical protein
MFFSKNTGNSTIQKFHYNHNPLLSNKSIQGARPKIEGRMPHFPLSKLRAPAVTSLFN